MNDGAPLPDGPYKGLARFDDSELDERFFFGRDRETEIVASNLIASRLSVLYGPSGVGKSSLLRAGVVRRLRALVLAAGEGGDGNGALPVVVDQWRDDPLARDRRGGRDPCPNRRRSWRTSWRSGRRRSAARSTSSSTRWRSTSSTTGATAVGRCGTRSRRS